MNNDYEILFEMSVDGDTEALHSQLCHVTMLSNDTSNDDIIIMKIAAIRYNTVLNLDELIIHTMQISTDSTNSAVSSATHKISFYHQP